MRRLLVLLCSGLLLAVGGCGSSEDTVSIAGQELTVSGDTIADQEQELIAHTPYLPWFRRCFAAQMHRLVTPAVEEELEELPEAERDKRFGEAISPVSAACEVPGRRYIDPHATGEELALVRALEKNGVGSLLRGEGFSEQTASCIEDLIGGLSGKQLVTLLEATPHQRELQFSRLGADCG